MDTRTQDAEGEFSQTQVDAYEELKALVEKNALATFVPSPALEEFMKDGHRWICLVAANRIGKTYQTSARLARYAVENPGSRCRVVGPTRRQVQDVSGRYLSQFLEPYLSDRSYYIDGRGWNDTTIQLTNGSIIQLRSYEDKPTSHAGDELDLILLDEPPPQKILTESLIRITSRKGRIWLALTPVGAPVEYLRDMVEDDSSVWKKYRIEFSHWACPWYTTDQVEQHLEAMRSSPWEWRQRVEGHWDGITEDRLFTGLSEENVSPDPPDSTVEIAIGMDHGERAGHETALLAGFQRLGDPADPSYKIWILDEYQSSHSSNVDDDVQAVLDMIAAHAIKPDEISICVGDVNRAGKGEWSGWKVNQAMEHVMCQRLGRRMPPFRIRNARKGAGSVSWGLRIINWALARNELVIHPRCERTIKALKHFRGTDRKADESMSHMVDALRYLILAIVGSTRTYSKLRFE